MPVVVGKITFLPFSILFIYDSLERQLKTICTEMVEYTPQLSHVSVSLNLDFVKYKYIKFEYALVHYLLYFTACLPFMSLSKLFDYLKTKATCLAEHTVSSVKGFPVKRTL